MEEKTNIAKAEKELRISDLTEETIVPARKIIIDKIEQYEEQLEQDKKNAKIIPKKTALGLLLAMAIGSTLLLHMTIGPENDYFEELNIIEKLIAYIKDIPFPFTTFEALPPDAPSGPTIMALASAITKPLSIIGTLIISIRTKIQYKNKKQKTTIKIEELYKIKETIDKVAKEKFGIDMEKAYAEYIEIQAKEEALRQQKEAEEREQKQEKEEMSTQLGFGDSELAAAIKKR